MEEENNADAETLNPNCSEVVWRLEVPRSTKEKILRALEPKEDEEEYETFQTGDSYPNGCVNDMIQELEGAEDVDKAKFILEESQGREGLLDYTLACLDIAQRFKKGEITKREVGELEKGAWIDLVEIHEDEDE